MLPCRCRMPSRWSPSHATTYYAARTGRKWISSSSSCGSVSPRAAGKCRRREREISIWTKALHCGFADERKSLRGASVGSRYSSQTSLKGGILSSFEAELYSQIAVTVLNLCKKKSFEIYTGDCRLTHDCGKTISPLTGTRGSRVPRPLAGGQKH